MCHLFYTLYGRSIFNDRSEVLKDDPSGNLRVSGLQEKTLMTSVATNINEQSGVGLDVLTECLLERNFIQPYLVPFVLYDHPSHKVHQILGMICYEFKRKPFGVKSQVKWGIEAVGWVLVPVSG